ncbi:FAD-binding protein [Patescibacteria group bacterium]|nr:FAD-binding protein [Patescibacteria group bacterium]
MDDKFKLIVDSFGRDRFKFNQSITEFVSSGLAGSAKLFFIAFTEHELVKIVCMARQLKLPYFLFGQGSKIALVDTGFDGLMIKNRTKNIQTVSIKGKVTKFGIGIAEALIEVESGLSINRFLEYLTSQGLETVDLQGLTGTIGGNLFFSKFLQNRVKSIKVLDWHSQIKQIDVENLNLKEHIILSAVFKIKAKQ